LGCAAGSVNRIGCSSLRAVLVIAFLLLAQFFTLSHSVDHDSGQSDCVVCRISNPHKQVAVMLVTADLVVSARAVTPVIVQVPPGSKPIVCDIELERAPPSFS